MTKKEAVTYFINTTNKWNDYYEMQVSWMALLTHFCKLKLITLRQYNYWGNPTSLEKFERWNNRNYKYKKEK